MENIKNDRREDLNDHLFKLNECRLGSKFEVNFIVLDIFYQRERLNTQD